MPFLVLFTLLLCDARLPSLPTVKTIFRGCDTRKYRLSDNAGQEPLPRRPPPIAMGSSSFEAVVFADNFVYFMSEIYDVEWQYQRGISCYTQPYFDCHFEEAIEFYQETMREELFVYLDNSPRMWTYDSGNYPVYAERVIRYFRRGPYSSERFIQLCVLLCSIASHFSPDDFPEVMNFAFVYIYTLALRVLRNGTFSDSTW